MVSIVSRGQVGKPQVISFLFPEKDLPGLADTGLGGTVHLSTCKNTLSSSVFSNSCYLATQPQEGQPGFGPHHSHSWAML